MKGWVAALILALGWLGSCVVDSVGDEARERRSGALLRAAQHTLDSTRVAHAQDFARYKAGNDSLRSVVTSFNQRIALVKVDAETLLVPRETFVYVTDTLVPKCEQCAARLDSAMERTADERRAANLYIDGLQAELARVRQIQSRKALTSRFGVSVGYGVMKVGEDVKAGPMIGLTVRAFP